jgi:hypothetical protein
LEATAFEVDNIQIAYVFHESGMSINVMYAIDDPSGVRGFKLSDGMEILDELALQLKFARHCKLVGTIRGSNFAIQHHY